MSKCKICGADISNGQEICEKCQSDLDAANQEDFDLEDLADFDFSEIELPELSGDIYETDLEFKLEDPNNDLENPNIFVHDFEIEEPQFSEEEERKIEEGIADIELPEFQEEESSSLTEPPEPEVKRDESEHLSGEAEDMDMLKDIANIPEELDAATEVADEIPDISDILEEASRVDSDNSEMSFDIPEKETLSEETSSGLLDSDEELMNLLDNANEESQEGLLSEDIDNLLAEATDNQEEIDLMDLLPDVGGDEGSSSENSVSDENVSFVDDLLGELDLGGMTVSETESQDSSDMDSLLDLLDGEDSADQSSNGDIFAELDDNLNLMEELPDAEAIANAATPKPKISIWKRLFGNLKDDKWEKQKEKEEKKEAEKLAKAEAEKEKVAEAEGEKGEGEEQKLDPKEAKKAEKKAKKEEKARIKEEKKAEKQKMKELAELEDADDGRINRVGAAIVFVFFGVVAAFVVVGTNIFSYNSSISRAATYFDEDKYNSAYNALWGLEIKKEDEELYSKVQMVMYLNKEWNSYENYTNIRMYPEALDSLLKGIRKYDIHIDDAKELEVSADYKKIRSEILKELKNEYGLNEKEAYKLLAIESQEDYSQEIIQLANEY